MTHADAAKIIENGRAVAGGNVRVSSIEGPVVKLQLEGACGDCPSSTMTMKMGLERRLKEAIPEISEVVQVLPDAPDLTIEAVDEVLEGVRPFLSVAGGSIDLVSVEGAGGVRPRAVTNHSSVRTRNCSGAHPLHAAQRKCASTLTAQVQPTVLLRLEGKSASLFSVKNEISQRIHRHFMQSGLRVEWEGE